MAAQPLITVCIPSYNGQAFIEATVKSVLAQSFADFELLVCDDASSDNTVEIVRGFTDARINLIQNETNLGITGNWLKTLSQSRGKYVKLMGGDDLLEPSCLARQMAVLTDPGNDSVSLTICNRRIIDESGAVVFSRPFPFRRGLVQGSLLLRRSIRLGSNLIGEPVVGLFRREALGQGAFLQAASPYLADMALWVDVLRGGHAFVDSSYLASFRISTSAASARLRNHSTSFTQFASALRSSHAHDLSSADILLGSALSRLWSVCRAGFMRHHFRRNQNGYVSRPRSHQNHGTAACCAPAKPNSKAHA